MVTLMSGIGLLELVERLAHLRRLGIVEAEGDGRLRRGLRAIMPTNQCRGGCESCSVCSVMPSSSVARSSVLTIRAPLAQGAVASISAFGLQLGPERRWDAFAAGGQRRLAPRRALR